MESLDMMLPLIKIRKSQGSLQGLFWGTVMERRGKNPDSSDKTFWKASKMLWMIQMWSPKSQADSLITNPAEPWL